MATPAATYEIRARDLSAPAFRAVEGSLALIRSQLGAISAAAAVGIFGRFANESLDFADRMQKLSVQLGTSTEFLSELRVAVNLSGGDFERTSQAIGRMQRTLEQATTGNNAAREFFEGLGISVERLFELRPEQQLSVIAQQISQIGNVAERNAALIGIFGRAGLELAPLFEQGAEGLQQLLDVVRETGTTLDQDLANAAAEANDEIAKLVEAVAGPARNAFLNLAQPIADLVRIIRIDLLPTVGRFFEFLSVSAANTVTDIRILFNRITGDAETADRLFEQRQSRLQQFFSGGPTAAGGIDEAVAGALGPLIPGGVITGGAGGRLNAEERERRRETERRRRETERQRRSAANRVRAGGAAGLGLVASIGALGTPEEDLLSPRLSDLELRGNIEGAQGIAQLLSGSLLDTIDVRSVGPVVDEQGRSQEFLSRKEAQRLAAGNARAALRELTTRAREAEVEKRTQVFRDMLTSLQAIERNTEGPQEAVAS